MRQSSFLRKQLILSIVVTVGFVAAGFFVAFQMGPRREPRPWMNEDERWISLARRFDAERAVMSEAEALRHLEGPPRPMGPPPMGSNGPAAPGHWPPPPDERAIPQDHFRHPPGPPPGPPPYGRPSFYLLDEVAQVVASGAQAARAEELPHVKDLPAEIYQVVRLPDQRPGAPVPRVIVRLSGTPVRYLYVAPGPRPPLFPPPVYYVLGFSLMSVLLSFGFLVYYLRKNAQIVEDVMEQLQAGNLKARLPIKKLDEAGRMMTRFNQMADEIESLVCRVRATEMARANLLQELGHDLRTPLASLQNFLETFATKSDRMTPEQKVDLATISLSEVKYLARLVEDLLFLARVDDPRYLPGGQRVDLRELSREEVEIVGAAHPEREFDVEGGGPVSVFGDPHLLRRLLRNALENARSFAKSRVLIRFEAQGDSVAWLIEDDGPGFPAGSLESFGEKRGVRTLSAEPGQRLSLGLGSVIMKAVATAHRGEIAAENVPSGGARVRVTLKTES